jgi:hypothetical protein
MAKVGFDGQKAFELQLVEIAFGKTTKFRR